MPKKKTREQVVIEIASRNDKFPPIHPKDVDFVYTNNNTKIEWCCTNNHTFQAIFKNILKGHGCRKCSMSQVGKINTKSTDLLLERLAARNSSQPNKIVRIKDITEYSGMTKKITWLCSENHEWAATPKTVLQKGTYCRKCADKTNAENQRFTTIEISNRIKEHNKKPPNKKVIVQDISNYKNYKNNKSIIPFKCAAGHEWSTPVGFIIDSHTGCPVCAQAGFSRKAIAWLEEITSTDNIIIQHALNGGEYKIPNSRFRADGYCKETNTVYEFHGDLFHGNPDIYSPHDYCALTKKTYGEMYSDTLKKETFLRAQGYNVIIMWERYYDAKLRRQKSIQQIIHFLEGYGCNVSQSTQFDLFLNDFNIAINYSSLVLHTHDNLADVNYHKNQHAIAKGLNIRLITIFSHEWVKAKEKVKDSLVYCIGKATKGAAGRKTIIKEIAWKESKSFLDKYHLLNSGAPVSVSLGAYDGKKLIAVMTFGKPTRETGHVDYYEMTRFVTDKKTHPGLASKMFKYAIAEYNFEDIIAFVDKRWFSGTFKLLTGFAVVSETKPTMWYTDGSKLYHRRFISRKKLLKELDQPSDTTKDSMMLSLGYKVIYDCGKLKLQWKPHK